MTLAMWVINALPSAFDTTLKKPYKMFHDDTRTFGQQRAQWQELV